jgi:AbrB family looped-hinge helix DNA binding protein
MIFRPSVDDTGVAPLEFRLTDVLPDGRLMETVRVSSKGQIVIPKDIRDAQRIAPGAELEIFMSGEEIHLRMVARPVARTSAAAGRGMLAAAGRTALSDDELRQRISARLKVRDAATKGRE